MLIASSFFFFVADCIYTYANIVLSWGDGFCLELSKLKSGEFS